MKNLFVSNKLLFRILRHVILFISMVLLFSWVAYERSDGIEPFLHFLFMVNTNAIFFFGYAYLSTYLLIPFLLFKKRFLLFAVIFLLSGVMLSWIKFTISDFLFYSAISPENQYRGFAFKASDIIVNTKDMTFIVALFSLLKFSRDNYLSQSNTEKSEVKQLEAEIMILEHQLDPHVIFNNFNNLYSISINRPELLNATIRKLKVVLEYLFLEEKGSSVSLKKELRMIENYIGLERLRYGERLRVNFEQHGNFDGARIAPLLLYTFVENCFEHGAGMDTEPAWIDIRIELRQSKLKFYAANSLPANIYQSGSYHVQGGLENTIRRLEILYPDSHRLSIREKQNSHIVELQMSLS